MGKQDTELQTYSVPIQSIADTAYMTAFYRAQESTRAEPHFYDPYARLLAGEQGQAIVESLPEKLRDLQGVVVRTRVYDEIITQLLEEETIDIVLNLGCGLDTRPYRLALPASLRWIEVDFPDLLAYKAEKLAHVEPMCDLERVGLDLADRRARKAFFTRVNQEAQQVLVLTEGLLVYLSTKQIAALATDLHEQSALRWWLTEFCSQPSLAKYSRVWNTLVPQDSHVRFAPEDGAFFFKLYGWGVHEFRIPLEEALRLKMDVPLAWLAYILIFMARLQKETPLRGGGLALFQRT